MKSLLTSLFITCRPKHQIKNVLVLVPLVFAGSLNDLEKVKFALLGLAAFCLASACVYIVNDIVDREKDAHHPLKKNRPIAQGTLSSRTALVFGSIMAIASIVISWFVSVELTVVLSVYIMLICLYSLWFKHFIIIDIFFIALGFVLRIIAGIVAIKADFSPWIIGATFFLSLFLASMKRESEYVLSEHNNITSKRKVLELYSKDYLAMISNSAAIMAIIIYFIFSAIEVNDPIFIITALPVAYGIYRFIWLVRCAHVSSDDPADILLRDKPLLGNILLYTVLVILLLYLF